MNLAGWRFVLFALIGTAAIVLLASIGLPGRQAAPIDPLTGRRGVLVRNAAEALQEARLAGDARVALERTRARLVEYPGHRGLRRVEALLVAELDGAITGLHPSATTIEAERGIAERARAEGGELDRRCASLEPLPAAALVAVLAETQADEGIAAATENFFAPLARWAADPALGPHHPDELAARLLERMERGDRVSEQAIVQLVRAFRAQDRPRARLRWALRGFGLFPRSRELSDDLVRAYLEQGGLREAFLVLGAALREHDDDRALWERRAQVASWLGLGEAEIEACRALLAIEESPVLHERLLHLYEYLGQPELAVPHATALARGSSDRDVLIRPARLALAAGEVDRALELLEEQARASDDPAWWHERIIEYAEQDLREDRVIRELHWLAEHYPERGSDAELEAILRRRGRLGELIELLEARLERRGDDAELEQELINLHSTLGNEQAVKALVQRQALRIEDPREFFRRLVLYRESGVRGLDEAIVEHARSPRLLREHVPEILQLLARLPDDATCREAATIVARRFSGEPVARDWLIAAADQAPDDAGRADAMERLARERPDDARIVAAWATRASWAGDLESETAAREQLLRLRVDDLGNRRRLADLYAAQERNEEALEQWQYIAAREGVESPAQLQLVDALLAADRPNEAMAILERRARLPGTSVADRLHVAQELFGHESYDGASRFYESVLDEEPENAEALLRLGQIRAWTNDPRGAIPYLERRLSVSDEQRPEVQFTLGECHWAIRQERAARAVQAEALRSLLAIDGRTIPQDVMVATMLAREGRYEESQPIFERVVSAQPGNVDIALDYADAMLAIGRLGKARELVDQARARDPDYSRGYRLDGMLALHERRYGAAAAVLAETIDRFGADAGTAAELARARQLAGDFDGAQEAYARAFALQPRNLDLEDELARIEDWLAPAVHVGATARFTGDDTYLETWLASSTPWKRGRTRLGLSVAGASYSGRAAAVDAGLTDVTSEIVRVDLSATRRFLDRQRIGGGVEFFPGANGNAPVSGWLGARLAGVDPYWSAGVRAWMNELFDRPAAAAGLGGRSTGGAVEGEAGLPARLWVGAGARMERLSLDYDGNTPWDPYLVASATLGWRAIEGALRVADEHRVESALMPGIVGARLPAVRPGASRDALSVWANLATYRLLGDAELSSLIPLGKRFDYVTLSARYDRLLQEGLGLMVESYIGRELLEGKNIFGFAAGVGWRPKQSFELALVGAYGSALGRTGEEDSFYVRLGMTWRW